MLIVPFNLDRRPPQAAASTQIQTKLYIKINQDLALLEGVQNTSCLLNENNLVIRNDRVIAILVKRFLCF